MSLRSVGHALTSLVLLVVPALGWAGQAQSSASPFKGEYFCTRNADSICVPFTRNLNQFRRLDFDVCDPRLSEEYPQFTRLAWEEIPFDLGLAEKVVKNLLRYPADPGAEERGWQAWLTASESLRAEGKLKLWRTRIDTDGDGAPETILRLFNPLSTKWWLGQMSWTIEPDPCPYRHNRFYMLDSPNDGTRESFNRSAFTAADIIVRHSEGGSDKCYALDRSAPASPDGQLISATRGVTVWSLFHLGAGRACNIDWVPTVQYRPLQSSRSSG